MKLNSPYFEGAKHKPLVPEPDLIVTHHPAL
jgi:hypothetical protein